MCRFEKLPALEYSEVVGQMIQTTGEPDDNIDIPHAAFHGLSLIDDPIEEETQELDRFAELMSVWRRTGALIDRDNRTLIQWEYDDIFNSYIARRADRSSQEPTEGARAMIKKWLDEVQESTDVQNECGTFAVVKSIVEEHFLPMLRTSLPKKLDHDSWIAEIARQKLQEDNGPILGDGYQGHWRQR